MRPTPVTDVPKDSLVTASGLVRRRLAFDRIVGWILLLAFVAVLFPLFDMIYWVGQKALPTFTLATLTQNQVGLGGGLYAMIVGTFVLLGLATAFATGFGLVAGFYTAEFAPPAVKRLGRLAGNLLAGVPAIVLGYFGYWALVLYTHWGFTTLAGGITLGVFMIPYVYRTTDLALSNVPASQREATLAVGASRFQYLARVAFRIAFPTILTGILFAMAIGVGDAAPVIYTAGWSNTPVTSLMQPTSFLTGGIWLYYDFPTDEGTLFTLAFQAALVVISIVLVLNVTVQIISDRYRQRLQGLFG
jgi:phosphate transport system permease protein